MIWWLSRNTRLASEKAALADLEGSVDWLQVGKWQANPDLAMCVDLKIEHRGEEFGFKMRYPSIFPDAPPMIFTDDQSRISLHQYGPDGELCLEHRPDNWQPAITGADMVASCHRLLAEEQPEGGDTVQARSAHVASLGRDLRSKFCRLLVTESDLKAINGLPEYTGEAVSLSERKAASTFISSINHIGSKDDPLWISDLVLPKADREELGTAVRVPGSGACGKTSADDLRSMLEGVKLQDLASELFDTDATTHLLMGDKDKWELFWLYGEAKARKVISYSMVIVPPERQRLPTGFDDLANKKVGIVGCGSVGSKIAASLCRTGVGKFLLIDEDIFFPGNVVRNELELNETGAHKSHALRDRLKNLAPNADVTALRMTLGGQESAESMTGALEALGDCDLLIDATASPKAFNMIASIATRQKKPMVWAEVFAGGIGGVVARARPDLDPVPLAARGQIEVWCNDQGVDWIRPEGAGQYDGQGDDGAPLIADDAEVTIIASHATRLATDILARPDTGIFPMSAYVIGLSSEWLFEQPFDTRPIDLKPDGQWGETSDALEPEELLEILKEHWPPKEGHDATAAAE